MEMPGNHYAEAILEHLPVGIGLIDAHDFRLLTANPLFLSFLDPTWQGGQALGRPVSEWIPQAEETGIMEVIRTVAMTGLSYHAELYPFPAFQRGFTYWDWKLEALRGPDGHIRYLLSTAYDMTEFVRTRRQAERVQETLRQEQQGLEEARQRQHPLFQQQVKQEKSAFLTTLSHELRTPMTVIVGYIELLEILVAQGEHLDMQEFQRVFTRLSQQSSYLASLLASMQEMAQIEAGQLPFHVGPCDLLRLLRRTIENLEEALDGRHIHLQFEGIAPGEAVNIRASNRQVTRIFDNLLSNALKYSPAETDIVVGLRKTSERPGEVVCWVRDEGIGISETELPRIFTCFYRIPESRYATRGLGIGLYIVKQLVEAHGGRVWAESKPGQGSTFYVTFPLLDDPTGYS
jgi:signal transduction histidine kinase